MYKVNNKSNYNETSKVKKILIIGGVAAGTSAASKARRLDSLADIKIIQKEPLVSYGSCGFPYVIEGIIENFDKLIARTVTEFKNRYNIEIIANTIATRIDPVKKQIFVKNLLNDNQSEQEEVFDYDTLIISTGARAVIPKIKGLTEKNANSFNNLFTLRNFQDAIRIFDYIKNAKSAVIVGAGLVGVEMTEALSKRGISVILIERSSHVLSGLIDSDMAELVEKEFKENNIDLYLQESVEEIISENNTKMKEHLPHVKSIKTNNRELNVDCLLLGVGVTPNSEIAKDAGIHLGAYNAIKIDDSMRTNIPDIFAAGDCATARNYVTRNDEYLPLGTTSNKQGRLAGQNAITGGNEVFTGIAGSAITKVFGLLVGKTGLNKKEAKINGFDPIEAKIKSVTRAGYYPDKKPIWIKLVADRKSSRILGAQIVGGESVKGRIDLISFALLKNATVDDLANFDSCYVPPVSPVWEPISIAAMQLLKSL